MIQHTKNQLKKFTKSNFIFEFVILIGLLFLAYLAWQGRNFPTKEQVKYIDGYVLSVDEHSYARNPMLRFQDINGNTKNFGCSYGYRLARGSSSCMSYDKISELFGKKVTIGWYYEKGVFGFQTSPPNQLVSLSLYDEQIITYEQTLLYIKKGNKTDPIIFIVLYSMYLLYVIYSQK